MMSSTLQRDHPCAASTGYTRTHVWPGRTSRVEHSHDTVTSVELPQQELDPISCRVDPLHVLVDVPLEAPVQVPLHLAVQPLRVVTDQDGLLVRKVTPELPARQRVLCAVLVVGWKRPAVDLRLDAQDLVQTHQAGVEDLTDRALQTRDGH